MRRRCAAVAIFAGALTLLSCAPARAATARVDVVSAADGSSTRLLLIYEADPGEANVVSVGVDPDGWYRVHDPGAAVAPGSRCDAVPGGDVRCFANSVEVRTGDMDDSVSAAAGVAVERVSGGDGNDVLGLPSGNPVVDASVMGGDGDDQLRNANASGALMQGGPGADVIEGGRGADVVDGGTGSDRIAGGEGIDTLANAGRLDGVTVDLAQGSSSAAGGEHDELTGVENVRGGAGPDVLSGDEAPDTIGGGPGDDTIRGAGGNDELAGDEGADTVAGDSGNDTLFAGSDFSGDTSPGSLSGGTGRDALIGGQGRDVFDGGAGSDWMLGQGGADVYAARDDELDWIDCGSRNREQVRVDVRDYVHGCGRVERSAAARVVIVYGALKRHKYDVGLACPSDMARSCEGTYRLTFAAGRTGLARFEMKPGKSPGNFYFESALSTAQRRKLAAAPPASVALRVATRDSRGHRVVVASRFPGPRIFSWPRFATGVDCDDCPADP